MLHLRRFEERTVELCLAHELPTEFLSPGIGQEAAAVALGLVLKVDDLIFATHRNHHHVLACGGDPRRVMAEIFGRATGYCLGRGGTWHVCAPDARVAVASAIVGAATPMAVGGGVAFRYRHQPNVAVSCMGDRSLNEGASWESINMAALWKLPVLFLCENNDAVPYDLVNTSQLATDQITGLVGRFHIMVARAEGWNFDAVYTAVCDAVERVRRGGGPAFLEILTMDWPGGIPGGRYTYETGPTKLSAAWDEPDASDPYRGWRAHDTIIHTARQLLSSEACDRTALEDMDRDIKTAVDAAVAFARESPWPDPAEALNHVFA